jgi:hypothetical protein
LIDASVKVGAEKQAQELIQIFHYLQVQNELITQENRGLKEADQIRKKHNKKGVPLDLQQQQEYHGGAVLWSPRKVRKHTQEDHSLSRQRLMKNLRKQGERKRRKTKRFRSNLSLNRGVWRVRDLKRRERKRRERRLKKWP